MTERRRPTPFQADVSVLKKGGKDRILLVICVIVLIFCQNGVALGLARVLHLDPLGNSLIRRKDLLSTAVKAEADKADQESEEGEMKMFLHYSEAVLMLCVVVGVGTLLSSLLVKLGMTFPVYIGALIVAAVRAFAQGVPDRPHRRDPVP